MAFRFRVTGAIPQDEATESVELPNGDICYGNGLHVRVVNAKPRGGAHTDVRCANGCEDKACKCRCHEQRQEVKTSESVGFAAPDPFAAIRPKKHSAFNCALNGCGRKFSRPCDCSCHD